MKCNLWNRVTITMQISMQFASIFVLSYFYPITVFGLRSEIEFFLTYTSYVQYEVYHNLLDVSGNDAREGSASCNFHYFQNFYVINSLYFSACLFSLPCCGVFSYSQYS
jgi:hypothetical protein